METSPLFSVVSWPWKILHLIVRCCIYFIIYFYYYSPPPLPSEGSNEIPVKRRITRLLLVLTFYQFTYIIIKSLICLILIISVPLFIKALKISLALADSSSCHHSHHHD